VHSRAFWGNGYVPPKAQKQHTKQKLWHRSCAWVARPCVSDWTTNRSSAAISSWGSFSDSVFDL